MRRGEGDTLSFDLGGRPFCLNNGWSQHRDTTQLKLLNWKQS